MIHNWEKYILLEYNEQSELLINAKIQELKELIGSLNSTNRIIYEIENKDDHEVIFVFTLDDDTIKYELKIDDLMIIKSVGSNLEFNKDLKSWEEGFEIIENDLKGYFE